MRTIGILLLLGVGAFGCGGRAERWDSLPVGVQAMGLSGSVAVLDPALHRLLMLTSPGAFELSTSEIRVGVNPSFAYTDLKRERLFVLSNGVHPRRTPEDEWPRLSVVDGGTSPRLLARYELGQASPPTGLAIDPQGTWAVLYQPPQSQNTTQSGILSNPNELMLLRLPPPSERGPIDTTQPDYPVRTVTLDSVGSQPKSLTFTPDLELDGEPHRLLVVQTDHEVVLVDLSDPDLSRQTAIAVPQASSGQPGTPAEVVVYPGTVSAAPDSTAPAETTDTPPSRQGLLGLRMAADTNVVSYHFWISAGRIHASPNVVSVGGVPSDIEFVHTGAGQEPMLAALVPRKTGALGGSQATLIDTATETTQQVELADTFSHIERVTQEIANPTASDSNPDQALLWGESAGSIGFWSLEAAIGRPYRSVETYALPFAATAVHGVVRDASDLAPARDFRYLKILEAGQQRTFYVVNLLEPAAPPIQVYQSQFRLVVSPDGQRAWAFTPNSQDLGQLDFQDLHATSLTLERRVTGAHDIAQAGPPVQVEGDSVPPRALVALHQVDLGKRTELGATVLDARTPDAARTKFYSGLLLRGVP
jgi:hypothetical protein